MGIYWNPGNQKFAEALRSEIYVDKSELIQYTNKSLFTTRKYICVSRPRRFGKSLAANMLAAYYSRGCDSGELFRDLKLAQSAGWEKYLNKYDVVFLNMQEFLSRSSSISHMLDLLKKSVLWELLDAYPDYRYFDKTSLVRTMQDIYQNSGIPFVIIIDEWDCVFRDDRTDGESQEQYLDFLRDMLKDKEYVHLAYMTGILPIKKYGTHSALNMFSEFSMTNPRQLAGFVGFTEAEATKLCARYGMDLTVLKDWYDGYYFEHTGSIYNPQSVVEALQSGVCDDYWNQTETFDALRTYIDMNFDGLKDDIVSMMSGERVMINTGSFVNDMSTFRVKDDVLTLLIHLGYLGYDFYEKKVFIPNSEIMNEFVTAVQISDWGEVTRALIDSAETMDAILNGQEDKVASAIEKAHIETSHLQYNDENALSYTISLALYAARNYYTIYREFPTGKGFADMVFLPKQRFADKPALIVELKWDKSAQGAISQIKNKGYVQALEDYRGRILLVGINYDKSVKSHSCIIEEFTY